MTFPTLPVIPSPTKRPSEYAASLVFVLTQIANELGAGLSALLCGLLIVLAHIVTTGIAAHFMDVGADADEELDEPEAV